MAKYQFLCACIVAVLVFSFLIVEPAYAQPKAENPAATEEVCNFLSNVLGIDLTHYVIVQEGSTIRYPQEFGGLVKQDASSFTLQSPIGNLSVSGIFYNGLIFWIYANAMRGSPVIYTNQPSKDALVESRNILERYQVFAQEYGINVSHVTQALDLINSAPKSPSEGSQTNFNGISDFTPVNMTSGNMNLQLKQTSIDFSYAGDGFVSVWKGFGVSFGAHTFIFNDLWNLYSVGTLNQISQEQAKTIAWSAAQNYTSSISWNYHGSTVTPEFTNENEEIGFGMEPWRFPLFNDQINMGSLERSPLELYPMWSFTFYYKQNIGDTTGVQVGIWGDTQEIAYCHACGVLGEMPTSTENPEKTSIPTPTQSPSANTTPPTANTQTLNPFSTVFVSIVILAVVTLVAGFVMALMLQRRKRKSSLSPSLSNSA